MRGINERMNNKMLKNFRISTFFRKIPQNKMIYQPFPLLQFSFCEPFYYFILLPMIQKSENIILNHIAPNQQDLELGVALDQAAIHALPQGGLKIIYELILDLAYAIFITAITIAINLDFTFQVEFIQYLKEPHSIGFIITLVILGVITLALAKAYNKDTQITPQKKKIINLIQDILRSIIYVVMLIIVTKFVADHSSISLLIFSYVLNIISGGMFLLIRIRKWIYFLCGQGKDNLTPWSSKKPPIFQADGLSPKQNEIVNKIMSGLIEKIKKGATPMVERVNEDTL